MGLFSLEVPMMVALVIILVVAVVLLARAFIVWVWKLNHSVHMSDLKMERINTGLDQEGEEQFFGAVQ